MRVTGVNVFVVEVPQIAPIAPYRSHLRSSSTTQSGVVRIDTDEGLTGWGEFNVNFLPNLSGRRMTAEAQWIIGRDPQNARRAPDHVLARHPTNQVAYLAFNSRSTELSFA